MRALIVEEGDARGALTATRALHLAGWRVGVGSPRPCLASASRSCLRWHRIPSVASGHSGFLQATRQAIDDEGYEVVFGCGDAEVLALSGARDSLGAVVPYSEHEAVVRGFDKLELARAAERAGIRTPAMCPADSTPPWSGPILVKARTHAPPGQDGAPTRLEPKVARDLDEAVRLAAEMRRSGGSPFFQELVSGTLLAHVAVADRQYVPVLELTQRADHIWPPGAGVSVRARVVAPGENLPGRIRKLLRELGWFGLVQLQFILPDDGEPRLIDFNGRFYGSLALSLAGGCNLAATWAALATGEEPPPSGPPEVGARYQWLEGDLRRAVALGVPRAGQEALDCLRYARRAAHSIWSRDDPAPALRHTVALAERAGRKALRSNRSGSPTRHG